MPQIEVAFDIDANGIVNVSAKDLATGKEQQMTITGGTALSKDEIAKMQKEAEAFAAEDHTRREAAEARNQADSLTYQIDKALAEYGDKVPAEEKQAVEAANGDLKEALKGDDVERIKQATDAANAAFQRIGQAMYAQQQAQAASGQAAAERGRGAGRERLRRRRLAGARVRPTATWWKARSSRKEVRRSGHVTLGSLPGPDEHPERAEPVVRPHLRGRDRLRRAAERGFPRSTSTRRTRSSS